MRVPRATGIRAGAMGGAGGGGRSSHVEMRVHGLTATGFIERLTPILAPNGISVRCLYGREEGEHKRTIFRGIALSLSGSQEVLSAALIRGGNICGVLTLIEDGIKRR